jgi:beta-galactosidase/beta-glucuronidase
MPHVIRLRGPWECEAVGGDGRGAFRYARRFHQPTGLTAGSKVWLVVEGVEGDAEVRVNGQGVGKIKAEEDAKRFEIMGKLRPHNLLEITVQADEGRAEGLEFVRLEIEE